MTAECYWRSIQAEGALADAPGHFQYSTETGGFAQAGYFLGEEKDRGFEVVGRYAAINFDNNIVPIGGTTQIHDWTGGVNYYFAGHNLALQAAYTYRVNEFRGPSIPEDDQIFQLQAQLRF